jgi:hypothetical protein
MSDNPDLPATWDELVDRVDALVEEWHNGAGKDRPLHEFLGMTKEQYAEWIKNPDAGKSLPKPSSPT